MACGCQGNQWNPDSDLQPAAVGPAAGGYFWNGTDEDGNPLPDPPAEAPKWTPDEGTAE